MVPIPDGFSLVRSVERVRDLGEVLTPPDMVEDMLELLPPNVWDPRRSATFLEPACGDGNFLVAVLRHKAARILDCGIDESQRHLHLLQALSSIYGIDISAENIYGFDGGGHPGARTRLLDAFKDLNRRMSSDLHATDRFLRAAEWVVVANLRVGDMNPMDSTGEPTGEPDVPIVEYAWNIEAGLVNVSLTSIADVLARGRAAAGAQLTLEPPPEAQLIWTGPAERLHEAVPP